MARVKRRIRTRRIRLEASTACQLKCPACPTAQGEVGKKIGTGFLRFSDFKRIVNENPWISRIELSNWGEIFLNPDLHKIIEYAHRKNVRLLANNGVNLNTVRDEALEALAKFRFHKLSVSIDGASQETYAIYRVRGNFDDVIANVKRINHFKKQYRSRYPILRWQFVAFGHNEHEIDKARQMARELGMKFYLKLNWEDLYTDTFSPVQDEELIRRESKRGAASRSEYEQEHGEAYKTRTCTQLWVDPVVNYDGRVLGCCINHWGDFGHVEKNGLAAGLTSEKIEYAKQMLLGRSPAREDIPCTTCNIYETMQKNERWLRPSEIKFKRDPVRFWNMLRNKALPASMNAVHRVFHPGAS